MKDILRLALVLTVIAAGAGLILAMVETVTREPIEAQRREQTLKAIRAVLPPVDNAPDTDTVALVAGTDSRGKEVVRTFFRGRSEGQLEGIAFSVTTPEGYSGDIQIMVGVRPDGEVTGIEILSHAETPGLGDKIVQPWFKGQFRGKTLQNVDWRVKKDGGQFEQITGATISPRAIVSAVRRGLEFYHQNREAILPEEGGQ